MHTRQGATDWTVSLDQIEAALPNAKSVSLVVSWFGTDLRAGKLRDQAGRRAGEQDTSPIAWSVAGLSSAAALIVVSSATAGRPMAARRRTRRWSAAIHDLKARGYEVTLTPFILMDVPDGNALPDPYMAAARSRPIRGAGGLR